MKNIIKKILIIKVLYIQLYLYFYIMEKFSQTNLILKLLEVDFMIEIEFK